MNSTIKLALAFVGGAAVGAIAAWYFTKSKYEQIAQDEINSMKEVYRKKSETVYDDCVIESSSDSGWTFSFEKEGAEPLNIGIIDNGDKKLEYRDAMMDYIPFTDIDDEEEGGTDMKDKPYVIDPDELGDIDGYGIIELVYYADGVLADEYGEVIDNIGDTVGADFADHFGDYEDDVVVIRNDSHKTDYEITRDLRDYKDVGQALYSDDEWDT